MTRQADYKINDFFIKRWSSRAMSGQEISDTELKSLFEAARWTPSAHNAQPWRFIYAKRNTPHWKTFFGLLEPFNQSWCNNVAVFIVVISKKNFEHSKEPSKTHSFDTGAACENLALQGSLNGLTIRAIAGFNHEKTRIELRVPEAFKIEIMIALGRPGKMEDLPYELQKKEFPSDRKKVEEIIFEGVFE